MPARRVTPNPVALALPLLMLTTLLKAADPAEYAVQFTTTPIEKSRNVLTLAKTDPVVADTKLFSKDGQHHVYAKSIGLKKQRIIFDGQEGPEHDEVIRLDLRLLSPGLENFYFRASPDMARVLYAVRDGDMENFILQEKGKPDVVIPKNRRSPEQRTLFALSGDLRLLFFQSLRTVDLGRKAPNMSFISHSLDGPEYGPLNGVSDVSLRVLASPNVYIASWAQILTKGGFNPTELRINGELVYTGTSSERLVGLAAADDGKTFAWAVNRGASASLPARSVCTVDTRKMELDGEVRSLTLTPDGKHSAFILETRAGTRTSYTNYIDLQPQESFQYVEPVLFSPDGNAWAYFASNNNRQALILSGKTIELPRTSSAPQFFFGANPGDFAYRDDKGWIIPDRGTVGKTPFTGAVFTPDAKHLIAWTDSGFNVDGRETRAPFSPLGALTFTSPTEFTGFARLNDRDKTFVRVAGSIVEAPPRPLTARERRAAAAATATRPARKPQP